MHSPQCNLSRADIYSANDDCNLTIVTLMVIILQSLSPTHHIITFPSLSHSNNCLLLRDWFSLFGHFCFSTINIGTFSYFLFQPILASNKNIPCLYVSYNKLSDLCLCLYVYVNVNIMSSCLFSYELLWETKKYYKKLSDFAELLWEFKKRDLWQDSVRFDTFIKKSFRL